MLDLPPITGSIYDIQTNISVTYDFPLDRSFLSPREQIEWDYFENSVQSAVSSFDGVASVVFYDFNNRLKLSVNPDENFYPACMIKLPFLAAALKAVSEGRVSLDMQYTLKDTDRVDGSGVVVKDPAGTVYSVGGLLSTMIMYSDNVALNILTDIVGIDYANAAIEGFSLHNTKLYHKLMYFGTVTSMDLSSIGVTNTDKLIQNLISNNYIKPSGNISEDFVVLSYPSQMILDSEFESFREPLFKLMKTAYPVRGYNQITASDTEHILEMIYEGALINGGFSRLAVNILEGNKLNDRIPAGLPEGVIVAHKTGSTDHVVHDAGIIYTPKGDFIICVFTRDSKEHYAGGQEFIRKIALLSYQYKMGELLPPFTFR